MFKCDKCGVCCRNINKVEELSKYDDGTGTCIYLINNLCSIYEKRPLVCRVDEMYNKYFIHEITKVEFYKMNENACKILKEEFKYS